MLRKILSSIVSILLLFSSWGVGEIFFIQTHAGIDPGFAGEYYTGTNSEPFLPANFILSRVDTQAYFDWGTGSPDASIPSDGFTARWTGDLISDQTGSHTFRTRSDDGIRIYIDGNLIINNWTYHAPAYNTGTYTLTAGTEYDIVVEFFEGGGGAVMELDWQRPGDTSYIALDGAFVTNSLFSPAPPTDIFLSNTTLYDSEPANTLVGMLSSEDQNLTDSHSYSLVSGSGDNDNGDFSITGDLLYIDTAVDYATQNSYSIRIQTNDGTFSYEKIFTINVIDDSSISPGFCGAYYLSPYSPANLVLERVDQTIDFNWGTGSPDPSISIDNFTIRWEGYISSDQGGTHNFRTQSDDGVRVSINNNYIINNWTNHGPTYDYGSFDMVAGKKYFIVMEFYEAGGGAVARLNWEKPSGGGYVVIDQDDVGYIGNCDSNDTTAPTITSSNPLDGSLIPRHDFDIVYNYTDDSGGVGVDTTNLTNTNFGNNIAPNASISATANTIWGSVSGTGGITNGIKSGVGNLDYEYHSDTPNAFIEFEWPSLQKIGHARIYNRSTCCEGRLSGATIRLYDDIGTLLYTHTLGNTDGLDEIEIDFNSLGEIHNVSRLRLDSNGAQSYINLREIEIFPIEEKLQLYKWDGTSWGADIAPNYIDFGNDSFTSSSASFPSIGLPYGKYKTEFQVQDLNGNTTNDERIFYIDEPSFVVSSPEIDLGTLSSLGETFSSTVTITVETVGAAFDVYMETGLPLSISGDQIQDWDNTHGFGYQAAPFTGTLSTIVNQETLGSQGENININGDKNTYTFDLQLGALIHLQQSGGEYIGDMDFGINLMY